MPLASDCTASNDSFYTGPDSVAEYWGPRFSALVLVTWATGLVLGFKVPLAILTAVGFLTVIVGLRSPFLGLLGVGMLCTLDSMTKVFLMTGGLLRWSTFAYWLLFVMFVTAPVLIRQRDINSRLLHAFLALMFFGLLFSPAKISGLLTILPVFVSFGLLIYFLRAIGHNWYWFGVVNGLLSGTGSAIYYLECSRHGTIVKDPNFINYFPLTGIFAICIAFHFTANQTRKQLILTVLAYLNYCWVFLSGSRGGILVASICITWLMFQIRDLSRQALVATCALMLGLVVLTQFSEFNERAIGRVRQLLDSDSEMTSRTSNRSDLMVGAWRMFLDDPMGIGTGGFHKKWATLSNARDLALDAGKGEGMDAHSAWTKTLAENGLLGWLLLASYLCSFPLVGWLKQHREYFFLGLLVTCSLSAAFLSIEFYQIGPWFLTAAVTALFHGVSKRAQFGPHDFRNVPIPQAVPSTL